MSSTMSILLCTCHPQMKINRGIEMNQTLTAVWGNIGIIFYIFIFQTSINLHKQTGPSPRCLNHSIKSECSAQGHCFDVDLYYASHQVTCVTSDICDWWHVTSCLHFISDIKSCQLETKLQWNAPNNQYSLKSIYK